MSKQSTSARPGGPLHGVRVVEFAGLGPAPFCGMLLADMGAEVIRIDRPAGEDYRPEDVESRGRHSLVINLKEDAGKELALSIIAKADILIEGFRPGVMEKLQLGPDIALNKNPRLVYGRMTGWGQTGPLAHKAGHDLNYLSISGALHALGTRQKPAVPLNLIADFGGGALYLAMGVLAALHHARNSGEGQVVDCAMVDGVVSMMNMIYGDFAVGNWNDERESNVIDGAAHFYNVYQCQDGNWLAVAAIEKPFYQNLLQVLDISDERFQDQWNRDWWPQLTEELSQLFSSRSRDEWMILFDPADACVTPVLSLEESSQYEANEKRKVFVSQDGIKQAAPAPRFGKTPAAIAFGPQKKGSCGQELLKKWGVAFRA